MMAGRKNRRTQIAGQFSWQLVEMQESPAYRVLSLSERRLLARLEIELGHHGGKDNGKLPVTFDNFESYGVHRHSIAPAMRAVVALGFVEITQEGRAGNAEWRRPTLFRLTYRHTVDAEPTNEWRRIDTMEAAEATAKAAREPPKKQKSSGGNRTKVQCGNRTTNRPIHSAETTTTCVGAETALRSISRAGGRSRDRVKDTACTTTTSTSGTTDERPTSGGRGEPRTFAVISGGVVTRVGVRTAGRPRRAPAPMDADAAVEALWRAWPKTSRPRTVKMKRGARTAFYKAVARGIPPEELLDRAHAYRAHVERVGLPPTKTKFAHRWLAEQEPTSVGAAAAR